MKKSILTIAGIIMMGLTFVSLDVSAASEPCKKDGQYIKGSGKKATCESCPGGFYCPDRKNKKKCPAGSFCPAGSVSPKVCEGNTHSSAGQSSCSEKCDGANQIVNSKHTGCTNCSSKLKPNDDHTACVEKCEDGEYVKNKKCEPCEAGHYCPDKKNRKTCPAGSFCPARSVSPQVCEGNTFSSAGQSSCSGKCDGTNQIVNSKHTGCTSCSSKLKPNDDHTACVVKCEDGEYVKNKKCEPCEAGYYCPDKKNRKICPAGSSCLARSVSPQACEGNTYSATGKSSCSKKCDGANQIVNSKHTGCTSCPSKQKPNEKHTACEARCDAGRYAKNKDCPPCEVGYYCPDGKNRKRCANGSIPNTTRTGCQVCSNGTYEKNFKECAPCPAGSYCSQGKKSSCTKKQYCPANSTKPNACPAHATCDGKTFTCKKGYKVSGNACVK